MLYHYARTVPSQQLSFACYENDVFIGVICYGGGANNNLAKSLNLHQGQIMELVRVALNGKQVAPTSKFVALSMKLIKKYKPLVKALVSYADTAQNHVGTIYQATNWIYTGESIAERHVDPETGKAVHSRSLHSKYGTVKGFTRVKDKAKLRYIYCFDKDMRRELEVKALPYQRREHGLVPMSPHQEEQE
jgi:hypothetical protein